MTTRETQLLVLGGGPGGYAAAFRAADLGLRVTLVEREAALGGVCLHVGCIPSKALLHTAALIDQAANAKNHGVTFGEPQIDLEHLRGWKTSVVQGLAGGLTKMADQRGVEVVRGEGRFLSSHSIIVDGPDDGEIRFERAIVAVGSRPIALPGFPDDPRILDSTGALELANVPGRLAIIGGGIIGLEMATVYASLGSRVTIIEGLDRLMPGADPDLIRPLQRRLKKKCDKILLDCRVEGVEAGASELSVQVIRNGETEVIAADAVLVAVGRRANGDRIDAEKAGLTVDERGRLPVDERLLTNVPHIAAIGDVTGDPMLAHRATHQGHVAAEVAAELKRAFEPAVIPSVAYTDPEVAWVGVTEEDAKSAGQALEKSVFPWAASGRAQGIDGADGLTKLLFDAESGRIVGGGIVGRHAGDLIGEIALAIELGADAADMALTIHPHPTLSETLGLAAEVAEGTVTDLFFPRSATRPGPRT